MKKSIAVRVLCLGIALVVLSGAVAVAAIMGSPYETLKRATLDAITVRNVTVEGQLTLSVNGEIQEEVNMHYVTGDNSYLTYDDNRDGESNFTYSNKNLYITPSYMMEEGPRWYYAEVSQDERFSYRRQNTVTILDPEDRNSSEMRFMELLVDALVGDLKNNITMTSGDGVRVIRGTLTESQMPELAKAGLAMIAEQSGGYYSTSRDISFNGKEYVFENMSVYRNEKTVTTWKQNVRAMTPEEKEALEDGTFYDKLGNKDFWGFVDIDGITYLCEDGQTLVNESTSPATRADFRNADPLDIPMKSLAITYVHGEATVDADGNLLSADVIGNAAMTDIFGTVNNIEIKLTIRYSEIGTSNPVCPIPGAEQLLTADYMQTHFADQFVGVYFTLNEDGSIDTASITTTHPGENEVALAADYAKNGLPAECGVESIITITVAEENELDVDGDSETVENELDHVEE